MWQQQDVVDRSRPFRYIYMYVLRAGILVGINWDTSPRRNRHGYIGNKVILIKNTCVYIIETEMASSQRCTIFDQNYNTLCRGALYGRIIPSHILCGVGNGSFSLLQSPYENNIPLNFTSTVHKVFILISKHEKPSKAKNIR